MTYANYKQAIKDRLMTDIDTQTIAENILNACKDMDFLDYKETSEKDLNDLEEALYTLKVYADNEREKDHFRTLMFALALIFEGV